MANNLQIFIIISDECTHKGLVNNGHYYSIIKNNNYKIWYKFENAEILIYDITLWVCLGQGPLNQNMEI